MSDFAKDAMPNDRDCLFARDIVCNSMSMLTNWKPSEFNTNASSPFSPLVRFATDMVLKKHSNLIYYFFLRTFYDEFTGEKFKFVFTHELLDYLLANYDGGNLIKYCVAVAECAVLAYLKGFHDVPMEAVYLIALITNKCQQQYKGCDFWLDVKEDAKRLCK